MPTRVSAWMSGRLCCRCPYVLQSSFGHCQQLLEKLQHAYACNRERFRLTLDGEKGASVNLPQYLFEVKLKENDIICSGVSSIIFDMWRHANVQCYPRIVRTSKRCPSDWARCGWAIDIMRSAHESWPTETYSCLVFGAMSCPAIFKLTAFTRVIFASTRASA